jgi:hypothetical protein
MQELPDIIQSLIDSGGHTLLNPLSFPPSVVSHDYITAQPADLPLEIEFSTLKEVREDAHQADPAHMHPQALTHGPLFRRVNNAYGLQMNTIKSECDTSM